MKRIFLFWIILCLSIVEFSVCYAGEENAPLEIQRRQWYTEYNLNHSFRWQCELKPIVDSDNDITPDEYYWKIYNQVRNNGGTDTEARTIAGEKYPGYASRFNPAGSLHETIQYWVTFIGNDNKLWCSKVSVDLRNYRFRFLKSYILDNNLKLIKSFDEKVDDWTQIEKSYVIKESIQYYMRMYPEAMNNFLQ